MPYSHPENKQVVQEWVNIINPITILDVGIGCGTYSDLLRNESQIWYGLEIHEPYIHRFKLLDKYDLIIKSNILDLKFKLLPKFDLIIAGDIIEHLEKPDALVIIEKFKQFSHNFVVSIPIIDCPQGECQDNKHEAHLSQFNHEELIEIIKPKDFKTGSLLGYYWYSSVQ